MHTHVATLAKWLGIAALGLVASASAQQTGLTSYDVELIVFRTLTSKASPEQWNLEAGTADQHLAVPEDEPLDAQNGGEQAIAPPPSAPLETFPALATSKLKLTSIADSLRRSRNYQPLAHFGWTQPGFPRGEARYMSIDGLIPAGTGLGGQVALSRGRYLHLTLELTYDSPEDGQRMVLKQTRRMRSNERHYIDHPKFGVIAIITPSAN
jgi:hypothetical protein